MSGVSLNISVSEYLVENDRGASVATIVLNNVDPGVTIDQATLSDGRFVLDGDEVRLSGNRSVDFEGDDGAVTLTLAIQLSDGSTVNETFTVDIGDEAERIDIRNVSTFIDDGVGERVISTNSKSSAPAQTIILNHDDGTIVSTGDAADTIIGGGGDDRIEGARGDDLIEGGAGNDVLAGFDARSITNATVATRDSDFSTGSSDDGSDTIDGGEGDDVIHGGRSNDLLIGGLGNDTAIFRGDLADCEITADADGEISILDRTNNRDGQDVLIGIETLVFDDVSITADQIDTLTETVLIAGDATAVDSRSGSVLTDVVLFNPPDDVSGLQFTVSDSRFAVENGSLKLRSNQRLDFEASSAPVDLTVTATLGDGTTYTTDLTISIQDRAEGIDITGRSSFVDLGVAEGSIITRNKSNSVDQSVTLNDEGGTIVSTGDGDDTITGGAGDDRIEGADGIDLIVGGGGDDTLAGFDAISITRASLTRLNDFNPTTDDASSDTIDGGAGNDLIHAGAGDDLLIGGTGDDWLQGGDGTDTMIGGAGDDTYFISSDSEVIEEGAGGGGNDIIIFDDGTDADDLTFDRADDDLLITHADGRVITVREFFSNPDQVIETIDFDAGGSFDLGELEIEDPGEELVRQIATPGQDTIIGGADNDQIEALEDDDLVSGGDGNDDVRGQDGNDTVSGDDGQDSVSGGAGQDSLSGGEGNDTLWGDAGDDIIYGGAGDDEVLAGSDDDLVYGLDGADTLRGYEGEDTLYGGADSDIIFGGLYTAGAEVGDHDLIIGEGGDDDLRGAGGNDEIHGNIGADKIRGDDGDDTIFGGDDEDSIFGGDGQDVIEGGSGRDFIWAENDADRIDGGAGDDRLYAQDGADTVIGGEGNDWVEGGAGADVFVFDSAANTGNDVIADFDAAEDRLSVTGADAQTLFDNIVDRGGSAIVTHDGGEVRLLGVDVADLTIDIFV